MSHEIQQSDGLVLTGQPAWHGLGLVVAEAPTPAEALKLAGIDWTVSKRPLLAVIPTGNQPPMAAERHLEVPSDFAVVRNDIPAVLGTVGADYETFQNADLAEMADALEMRMGGSVKVETAGSLRGGRVVFFLVRTGEFGVGIRDGDRVQTYGLFTTAHDGSQAIRAFGTSIRVVCANTLAMADAGKKRREGFVIRHTRNLGARVEEAKEALAGIAQDAETFNRKARTLANRPLSQGEVRDFFVEVYESTYDRIPFNPKDAGEKRRHTRAVQIVSSWLANMDHPNQQEAGVQGTAWAALNSITQWADHERTVRTSTVSRTPGEARTWGNLFGSGAALKQTALEAALAI